MMLLSSLQKDCGDDVGLLDMMASSCYQAEDFDVSINQQRLHTPLAPKHSLPDQPIKAQGAERSGIDQHVRMFSHDLGIGRCPPLGICR